MYGSGLLGKKPNDFLYMDFMEFIKTVEGALLWDTRQNDERLNQLLDWLSWFAANQMKATGNFKKSTSAKDIKEGLFKVEEEKTDKDRKEEYETGKQKLLNRFGIPYDET